MLANYFGGGHRSDYVILAGQGLPLPRVAGSLWLQRLPSDAMVATLSRVPDSSSSILLPPEFLLNLYSTVEV
jgi:hypothetical protein